MAKASSSAASCCLPSFLGMKSSGRSNSSNHVDTKYTKLGFVSISSTSLQRIGAINDELLLCFIPIGPNDKSVNSYVVRSECLFFSFTLN